MLTSGLSLQSGAIDRSPLLRTEFFDSRRIGRLPRNHGIRRTSYGVYASHISGSGKSRASLAYLRSLSVKGLKTESDRSATHVERHHVIPYSELVLKRKLDGEHSLIEAAESDYCWEDAWKLYMQSQTATLKELAARVEECKVPQISDVVEERGSCDLESGSPEERGSCEEKTQRTPSAFLSKVRGEILGRRRTSGLLLLNVLAALYGSSTVAGKFAADVAPGLPASLSSLVRFSSALAVFLPTILNILSRVESNVPLLKAGAELGALLFAAAVLETCGNGGASSDAPVLFAFTVVFVPIMELCAGRQSVRNITRIASLVALSGMGVLEEEGLGWKGISLPQVGDMWGLAASAIYALHIFRSEAHSEKFKPFEITAIQCGTVASLSLLWEISRVAQSHTSTMEYMTQLQALPWGPLVYTGLVCSGLCSWLEIHGLRSVHASTATMVNTTIPIWGAFLSFFLRGESLDDSAMVGGTVILVASLFAQMVSSKQEEQPEKSPSPTPTADHVQGAIITSQLKFPYYAAQAKRLLVEAKFKLLSMKSLVMSATSTLLTSSPPAPPGSLHASTAIATSVVTTSSSSDVFQWVDIAVGVLESAITALGSDLVQAVEQAEDVAKLVEQATQAAVDHVASVAASVESVATWALPSLEFAKTLFVDTSTSSAAVDSSLSCALPHADAVVQALLICTELARK